MANDLEIEERLSSIETQMRKKLDEIDELKRKADLIRKSPPYDFNRLLKDEAYRIKLALLMADNRRDAAEKLGCSERTLYRKVKEYSL